MVENQARTEMFPRDGEKFIFYAFIDKHNPQYSSHEALEQYLESQLEPYYTDLRFQYLGVADKSQGERVAVYGKPKSHFRVQLDLALNHWLELLAGQALFRH